MATMTQDSQPIFTSSHRRGWFVWCLRMAWRDTRGSRAHLILSILALAVGLAALVAIHSFGRRLDDTIEQQTRILLGADFSIRSLHPFSEEAEAFLATLPGESVRETRFFSMVLLESTGATQFSQIRALTDRFPFYGELRADPVAAAFRFLDDPDWALAEESLMAQTGATIGDKIRIGDRSFRIAGTLLDVSGEALATSTFIGPRIYISAAALDDTGLLGPESLARYFLHMRLPPELSAPELLRQHRGTLADLRLEMETAEQRKAVLGNLLDQVYLYLAIGALTAILLGGIGCAGSIQLYARRKRAIVATLRCLGTPTLPTFMIYLLQAAAAALVGGSIGAMTGLLLQWLIPVLLADFLPIEIAPGWSIATALWSLGGGMLLAFAFTAWPLCGLRQVAPLEAVRSEAGLTRRDPVQTGIGLLLWIALFLFCVFQTPTWKQGVMLAVSLTMVFGCLAGVAKLLMALTRKTVGRRGPFAWRQGIANIHRPLNQTTLLLLALGLGTFLLATLALTQANLLRQFRGDLETGQPNLILFNIQPPQRDEVINLIKAQDLRVHEITPIVTMRLESVQGRRISDLRNDPTLNIPHWVLYREYRSTYRDSLLDRDQVIAGHWQDHTGSGPIPISIEAGLSEYLGIGLGDRLVFNVQGVPLDCVVRSIRRVDWREMRTNFFVIFPAGVLEDAPHNFAVVTTAPSAEIAAQLQRTIVPHFPNVSAVDLRLLLSSINDVVNQASFVVRFMALFSVITGFFVLGATLIASRHDRIHEIQLLRTLGASRQQLNRIMTAEFVTVGGIASLSGLLLAILASWAAARWMFRLPYQPDWSLVAILPAIITLMTLLLGRMFTRISSRLG